MSRKPSGEPQVIFGNAADGAEVVMVEIVRRPGTFVTLDRADFDRWKAAGRPLRFYLNQNGPWTGTTRVVFANPAVRGALSGLARELLRPPAGAVVSYRDGNQLNLRRSNLTTKSGRAPGAAPATSEPDEFAPTRLAA